MPLDVNLPGEGKTQPPPGDVRPPPTQNVNTIANASQWAVALLEYMGLPNTSSNETFLTNWAAQEGGNWHNTARYNPLNTTQAEPGYSQTGTQGNIGSYTSWQQGLQATAQTLKNGSYPQIMAALQSGFALEANAAGTLTPNLNKWGTRAVSSNATYNPSGNPPPPGAPSPGGTTPGGAAPGDPPPITNLPALDAYIRLNYPNDAWLLDVPEVRSTIEKAVSQKYSTDQVQAMVQQTAWWRTTSQARVKFDQIQHATPEELNFNDPGSKISSVLANVLNIGAQYGTNFGPAVMHAMAMRALEYGWSNQQIQANLGSLVWVKNAGAGVGSNDPQVLAQLTKAAGTYLVNPNQTILNTYAKNIAMGTQSQADWEAYLKGQAAAKYPSMAGQINQGMTPSQIIDPLRSDAGQLMEVAPSAINFISDPTYSKILTYRPPDAGGKVQPIRTMTNSEMETYLRGTDQYAHTQGARNNASDLSQSLLTTLGKVAGT